MKRTLLFVLALIALGCKPPPEPPPEGPFEAYYDNGQLEEKGIYKDGQRDGPYEFYYDNGQLSSKVIYKDGKLHGPVEIKGTYNNDEKCGEWFEDGETVTYGPCRPDLEDGN